ncbi:MAG TPA: YbaB/EbfC family nucleoid-associated protein [bacterium]|mgnify:CR=1 FL=1|nr:YbaB/EbfC family nucleoid-associated protein [bacterium]HPN67312.1 YbaB/EbfC family nucleoid-associated protein [bacterium]
MGIWDTVKEKGAQAKQLYELQKKAKKIQKELQDLLIEATSLDGKITVVFNGEQKVEEVNIDESLLTAENKSTVEKGLKDAIAQALKKAQQVASDKMKEVAGDMGLPGF